MSTAARKARKRSGEKFVRKTKTPTPPEERSYVTEPVQGPGGTKFESYRQPRSAAKVKKFLEKFSKPSENAAA